MNRVSILEGCWTELGLSYETNDLFIDYVKNNREASDFEFYKEFNKAFPYVDLAFKINEAERLRRIDKHLVFFKVIAIIAIVVSALIAIIIAS